MNLRTTVAVIFACLLLSACGSGHEVSQTQGQATPQTSATAGASTASDAGKGGADSNEPRPSSAAVMDPNREHAAGAAPAARPNAPELGFSGGEDFAENEESLDRLDELPGDMALRRERGAPPSTDADGGPAESPDAPKTKNDDRKKPEPATWKRAEATPNASVLQIGDREDLALGGMQVRTQIDGFRARVLIDYFYYNDKGRQLEGTFKLRLPEDASPYFFAFGATVVEARAEVSAPAAARQPRFFSEDQMMSAGAEPERILADRREVWTSPKEARMVTKEKAAHAYIDMTRRRIDPALMEWAGAGVFQSRVFPLMPNQLHQIVVGYEMNLTPVDGGLEYRLELPAGVPDRVVDINVADIGGVVPVITPAEAPITAGGRTNWYFQGGDAKTITVRFPNALETLLAGTDATGPYFAVQFRPAIPATAAASSSHAVFAVDTSLSSSPDKFNVWLKMLKQVLTANRESITHFNVLFFDMAPRWWKPEFVSNTPEMVTSLLADADDIALEGATDVAAALREAVLPSQSLIEMEKTAPMPAWDVFLLSDGGITWGDGDLNALTLSLRGASGAVARGGRVFAYTTGFSGTDARVLGHVARECGGAVFSVTTEEEVAAASIAHRASPWRIESMGVEGCGDLLLAGRPLTVFPGQTLTLAGRGVPAKGAKGGLVLVRGSERITVPVPTASVLESKLAPRVYGQIAVGQLEDLGAAAESTAAPYAVHFRVVGQTCSLLMLDTEEDYKRYNIKPEEDALVVKSTGAAAKVQQVLTEQGASLGDPKKAFQAWLTKLESAPGMTFKMTEALHLTVESLPSDAFTTPAALLELKSATWDGVPGAFQELLASKALEYDKLSAEAARRFTARGPADALRAISSLIELNPGDGVLARDVGYSAMDWGLGGAAVHLFRRVADARPFEPQTYHALAMALDRLGRTDLAMLYFEVAVTGQYDARFGAFRQIVGIDYLRFLRRIGSGAVKTAAPEFAKARLASMAEEFDLGASDVVITITWNTDRTDVDLHVTEPTGEVCYYSNPRTKIGGAITQDVTQGYGPEMYVLKQAQPGTYQIAVNFFASDANRMSARTKVYATITQGWGTAQETVTTKVVVLETGKQTHAIGSVVVK